MADNGGAISVSKQPHVGLILLQPQLPKQTPLILQQEATWPAAGLQEQTKASMVITKHKDSSMNPVMIEISTGYDVVDSLLHFAQKRHVGLTVLSDSGSVSNVTLRHPMLASTSISLHGPFSLLSRSACFSLDTTSFYSSSSSSFDISLAGPHGQMYGGIVGGKVTTTSLVVIVVATITNPAFYRLPSKAPEDKDVDMEKSAIITIEESPAVAMITTSTTPLSIVYDTQSPPDHAMSWGRTSC